MPLRRRFLAVVSAAVLTATGTSAAALAADAPPAPLLGAAAAGAVPGAYVVVLEDGTTRAAARAAASRAVRAGGDVEHRFDTALNGYAVRLTPDQLDTVRDDPAVAFVAADQVLRASGVQHDAGWNLDRVDARTATLSSSYTYRSTGAGVTAYVVDTAVLTSHLDFGGRAFGGVDTVTEETECDAEDEASWHGTHVAGTIGGTRYGVAKTVKIVSVRVLDDCGVGTTATAIAGLEWVIEHHDGFPAVANMSLEGPADPVLDAVVRRVVDDGVPLVAAAGNQARNACGASPARVEEALTVGATKRGDARDASYSNYGSCLDLFAPGTSITSLDDRSTTATTSSTGTSMAAPHVAGTVALYLQQRPTATPAQVRTAVLGQSTSGKVTDRGAGSPDRLLYSMVATTPPGPTALDRLAAGRALRRGEQLCSPNGKVCLRQPADGRLVLIRSGRSVWTTGKRSSWTVMGADGNLASLDGARPVWTSRTGDAGPSTLRVQDDGTAGIYRDGDGGRVWRAPS